MSRVKRVLNPKDTHDYNPAKLQELIVYAAHKCMGDTRFGKTKLNKILFYSDFTAYRETGKPMTGAVYQHLANGPCPQQLLPALDALGDDITEFEERNYSYVQKRLVPRRAANLDLFSGAEIAIVDKVIEDLAPLTNKQASDLSHETVAWRITALGQEIPYGTAYLSAEEPSDEDLTWLDEEVSRRGTMERAAR